MSLSFAPRPIRPSGPLHGRAAAVAVLGLTFLVLALAKPWQNVEETYQRPTPTPRATPTAPPARVSQTPGRLDTAALTALTPQRDAWGIRLISASDGGGKLTETWIPVDASSLTGWSAAAPTFASVIPGIPAEHVVAIGITAPYDQTPLALRAWHLGQDRMARLVPLRDAAMEAAGKDRIAGAAAAAAPLGRRVFLPPADAALYGAPSGPSVDGIAVAPTREPNGARPARWPAGLYRFDALVGAQVRALTLNLPSALDPLPPELLWVGAGLEARALVADVLRAADFPVPQLAWVDGAGTLRLAEARAVRGSTIPTVGPQSPGDPLSAEEDGAFAAAAADFVDPGTAASWIAQADVAALGVVLPRGAIVRDLSVTELSPYRASLPSGDRESPSSAAGPANSMLAWSATGFAIPGGIYRIEARWWSDGVDRQGSWVAALSGGASVDAAADAWWQAAMRAYPYAGSWGVLATGEPSARARLFRLARAVPVVAVPRDVSSNPGGAAPDRATYLAVCRSDGLLDDEQVLLGVSAPGGVAISSVAVERLEMNAAPAAVPVVLAPTPVVNLTLVGLRDGGRWRPGVYRLTLETDDGSRSLDVGIGVAQPLNGKVLPPCSAGPA